MSPLRVVFAICALCLAAAVYSGHRIVSESHFPASYEPSRVPGVPRSSHRDDIAALEQEQRIRAAQMAGEGTHPWSIFDMIIGAVGGR